MRLSFSQVREVGRLERFMARPDLLAIEDSDAYRTGAREVKVAIERRVDGRWVVLRSYVLPVSGPARER